MSWTWIRSHVFPFGTSDGSSHVEYDETLHNEQVRRRKHHNSEQDSSLSTPESAGSLFPPSFSSPSSLPSQLSFESKMEKKATDDGNAEQTSLSEPKGWLRRRRERLGRKAANTSSAPSRGPSYILPSSSSSGLTDPASLLGVKGQRGLKELFTSLAVSDAVYANSEDEAEAVFLKWERQDELVRIRGFQLCLQHALHKYIVAEDDDCLYVAFRGTNDVQDLWADLTWSKQRFLVGFAHGGFLRRARGIRSLLLYRAAERRKKKLILCGHSLGGAIAQLVTLDVLHTLATNFSSTSSVIPTTTVLQPPTSLESNATSSSSTPMQSPFMGSHSDSHAHLITQNSGVGTVHVSEKSLEKPNVQCIAFGPPLIIDQTVRNYCQKMGWDSQYFKNYVTENDYFSRCMGISAGSSLLNALVRRMPSAMESELLTFCVPEYKSLGQYYVLSSRTLTVHRIDYEKWVAESPGGVSGSRMKLQDILAISEHQLVHYRACFYALRALALRGMNLNKAAVARKEKEEAVEEAEERKDPRVIEEPKSEAPGAQSKEPEKQSEEDGLIPSAREVLQQRRISRVAVSSDDLQQLLLRRKKTQKQRQQDESEESAEGGYEEEDSSGAPGDISSEYITSSEEDVALQVQPPEDAAVIAPSILSPLPSRVKSSSLSELSPSAKSLAKPFKERRMSIIQQSVPRRRSSLGRSVQLEGIDASSAADRRSASPSTSLSLRLQRRIFFQTPHVVRGFASIERGNKIRVIVEGRDLQSCNLAKFEFMDQGGGGATSSSANSNIYLMNLSSNIGSTSSSKQAEDNAAYSEDLQINADGSVLVVEFDLRNLPRRHHASVQEESLERNTLLGGSSAAFPSLSSSNNNQCNGLARITLSNDFDVCSFIAKLPVVTVLVLGATGSGKTSLIKALFQEDEDKGRLEKLIRGATNLALATAGASNPLASSPTSSSASLPAASVPTAAPSSSAAAAAAASSSSAATVLSTLATIRDSVTSSQIGQWISDKTAPSSSSSSLSTPRSRLGELAPFDASILLPSRDLLFEVDLGFLRIKDTYGLEQASDEELQRFKNMVAQTPEPKIVLFLHNAAARLHTHRGTNKPLVKEFLDDLRASGIKVLFVLTNPHARDERELRLVEHQLRASLNISRDDLYIVNSRPFDRHPVHGCKELVQAMYSSLDPDAREVFVMYLTKKRQEEFFRFAKRGAVLALTSQYFLKTLGLAGILAASFKIIRSFWRRKKGRKPAH